MRRIFIFSISVLLLACNGSGEEESAETIEKQEAATIEAQRAATIKEAVKVTPPGAVSPLPTKIYVDGNAIDLGGSLILQKDKDKLQPGADYLAIFTAPGGTLTKTSLVLNFLMALKPGTYPITGMTFTRKGSQKVEVYGDKPGDKQRLTNYKIHITECKDLGDNNQGGHKWSISGNFDEIIIPAYKYMLESKTVKFPSQIVIQKGSFNNLTVDDNWEQIVNKAVEEMNKQK